MSITMNGLFCNSSMKITFTPRVVCLHTIKRLASISTYNQYGVLITVSRPFLSVLVSWMTLACSVPAVFADLLFVNARPLAISLGFTE